MKAKAKGRSPRKKAKQASAEDFGIEISSPERVIYPELGLTKKDLADYYAAVEPLIMVDAANRPMTLIRCPGGRTGECFFQKHDKGTFGEHVKQIPIEEKDGETEDYLYFDDIRGLLACVQMGTIEFHGWGSKVDKVEYPDRLVFDLDPDVGLDFGKVKEAAVRVRDLRRATWGSKSFPLLTGGKGIHVVVPLDATADWAEVKSFADRFSRAVAEAEPDRFTANIRKVQRKGRIFLDWLRNQRGATAVMPYSARAREGAPVAAPIAWDELDDYDSGDRLQHPRCRRTARSAPSRSGLQAGAKRSNPCRMHSRTRAALLPLLFVLTAASPAELQQWKKQAQRVTITRDDWGIAHVKGKSDADAVFGMIYAQAEDDFPRIEANYLTALGRTAEAEGEKAIWQDLARPALRQRAASYRRITPRARHG